MAATTATLRRMAATDIEAVAEIERMAYPQPWSEQVFRDELAQDDRTYFVAEDDGWIVGYGGLMVVADEAHVTTVVVHPEARGSRVGTRLMLALADAARAAKAKSLTLEVRVSNQAAQSLYRRFGMAPVGVRKKYYLDEDALIMWVHDIDGDEFTERMDELRGELA